MKTSKSFQAVCILFSLAILACTKSVPEFSHNLDHDKEITKGREKTYLPFEFLRNVLSETDSSHVVNYYPVIYQPNYKWGVEDFDYVYIVNKEDTSYQSHPVFHIPYPRTDTLFMEVYVLKDNFYTVRETYHKVTEPEKRK